MASRGTSPVRLDQGEDQTEQSSGVVIFREDHGIGRTHPASAASDDEESTVPIPQHHYSTPCSGLGWRPEQGDLGRAAVDDLLGDVRPRVGRMQGGGDRVPPVARDQLRRLADCEPEYRERRRGRHEVVGGDAPWVRPAVDQNRTEIRNRPIIKPERFDGSEDWSTYIQHFEWVSELNGWNDYDKAKFLTVSVTGTARQVLAGVSRNRLLDYDTIVHTLRARFDPVGRVELHRIQLKNRVRKPGEPLSDLADDVRRLVDRVFADIPIESREKLARDCFIDALTDGEMRTRILQMRTRSIQEAMEAAIELEALNTAEHERNPPTKKVRELGRANTDDKSLQESIREILGEELQKIKIELAAQQKSSGNRQQTNANGRRCYNCGSDSHFIKDCPEPKKPFSGPKSGN